MSATSQADAGAIQEKIEFIYDRVTRVMKLAEALKIMSYDTLPEFRAAADMFRSAVEVIADVHDEATNGLLAAIDYVRDCTVSNKM